MTENDKPVENLGDNPEEKIKKAWDILLSMITMMSENNENAYVERVEVVRGESEWKSSLFGDGWDSPFQYEDKEGTIVGCYLDKHFIDKADAERDEYYASMAEHFSDFFDDEFLQ